MKHLSILLPSKNEPRILETLIEIDKHFPNAQVVIANDRYGKGKGWAMREALHEANGDIIAFIDGDMDIHPKMLWRLFPFLDDYDIVVGRKQVRGLLSRRILTRLSRLYIRFLFGLGIDTQTGIKLFRRNALYHWETTSFAFDIEILYNAKRMGYSIIEVPVEANIEKRMKIKSIIKCFTESLKIWARSFNAR